MGQIISLLKQAEALALTEIRSQERIFESAGKKALAAGIQNRVNPGAHRLLIIQIRDTITRATEIKERAAMNAGLVESLQKS